jgi:hypothetical protein
VPNKKTRKASKQKKSRAMPLAIGEPRLSAPRSTSRGKTANVGRTAHDRPAYDGSPFGSAKQTPSGWSPWYVALRQQAVMASAFFSLLRVQHKVAQLWLPSTQHRTS